ncbi:alkanesulfonate monooxygenase SsuD/methylene tetrahydromethanopterin reductase-like flavin-dependent oxidoreductase (luciferase family) [Mycolicibacterium sp. BK556]|uniref:LLM class flavin-dependent oxidoreductase n=1 Tax=unclassified Mycolicibacterium TaxID=2636767 RepID=UPI00160800CF|nr:MULTISPECIES: LLM class flavin-dependent oxidoreductase [unclassified Mycolicibacterium]MBB3603383.1 alkanesulfonate monooxygenase SsuD/methylene tetrahydromethanopterin reductase-like flavin-dependent oxidoreductase (luciferase family) [Mycolicibacterium sp. BK556]MBB3633578.1 alkanesulfonate monooxygenase SsuD/methylene tetrahydromethanopterin reductase-like flavin-dependent oxidoreductase (luciferase family) [Mycolicibacterium sp. BK607]
MFTLRFDMRAPAGSAPPRDLYAAAIDMCEWAEDRGAVVAVLSEHHGTEDGHLPAPHLLAAAIAARTKHLAILLAAVPITFWDPVRLAETMNVLDIISEGRVSWAFGIGHRTEEYEHFGIDPRGRGRLADASLDLVRNLLRGEPIDHDGRRIQVTPPPLTPGGPYTWIAGGSQAAARRAARHGLGFISQTATPGLKEFYENQCRANGFEPGPAQFPAPGAPTTVFVADDVDAAWRELGCYLLHDATMAASYRHDDDSVASISRATTVVELREAGGPYRIVTTDEAREYIRAGRPLPLLPLCGGLPPDVAWPYLKRAAAASQSALEDQ